MVRGGAQSIPGSTTLDSSRSWATHQPHEGLRGSSGEPRRCRNLTVDRAPPAIVDPSPDIARQMPFRGVRWVFPRPSVASQEYGNPRTTLGPIRSLRRGHSGPGDTESIDKERCLGQGGEDTRIESRRIKATRFLRDEKPHEKSWVGSGATKREREKIATERGAAVPATVELLRGPADAVWTPSPEPKP